MPFQSHHTHSINLLQVNPGFAIVCGERLDPSSGDRQNDLHLRYLTFSFFEGGVSRPAPTGPPAHVRIVCEQMEDCKAEFPVVWEEMDGY
ncbi:hypothetical protein EVAR_36542_1 [Eumeta japonica]|uniref:Uncharacterized protein n=1 Tax=Eumeta variegata TaxID=151549 RepID=A0A4C1Z9W2_EUMVA|nr:hypothetical protein EVAR_36542_1 [Eumeta japonica]